MDYENVEIFVGSKDGVCVKLLGKNKELKNKEFDDLVDFFSVLPDDCCLCNTHNCALFYGICLTCQNIFERRNKYIEIINAIEKLENCNANYLANKIELLDDVIKTNNELLLNVLCNVKMFILKQICAHFKKPLWKRVRYLLYDPNIQILINFLPENIIFLKRIKCVDKIKFNVMSIKLQSTIFELYLSIFFLSFDFSCKLLFNVRQFRGIDDGHILSYRTCPIMLNNATLDKYIDDLFNRIVVKQFTQKSCDGTVNVTNNVKKNKNECVKQNASYRNCFKRRVYRVFESAETCKKYPIAKPMSLNDCVEIDWKLYDKLGKFNIFFVKLDGLLHKYFSKVTIKCCKCNVETIAHLYGVCMNCLQHVQSTIDDIDVVINDIIVIISNMSHNDATQLSLLLRAIINKNYFCGDNSIHSVYVRIKVARQNGIIYTLRDALIAMPDEGGNSFVSNNPRHLCGIFPIYNNELFACMFVNEQIETKYNLSNFDMEYKIKNIRDRFDFFGKLIKNDACFLFCIEIDDKHHLYNKKQDAIKSALCKNNGIKLFRIRIYDIEKKLNYNYLNGKINSLTLH